VAETAPRLFDDATYVRHWDGVMWSDCMLIGFAQEAPQIKAVHDVPSFVLEWLRKATPAEVGEEA
jgi:hypothetical protein